MAAARLPLSVIVPTRNTRAMTLRCLAALDAAGARAAEVIVVDDGGRDGTGEAVRSQFPFVRVVARGTSGGFTAAVNEAWPLAMREIVLLLNSDTEVDADALTGFVAAFAADPGLGVAGASLRYPDGRAQWSAGREPSAGWLFALASGGASVLGRIPGWRRIRHESQAGARGSMRDTASTDVAGRKGTAPDNGRDIASIGAVDMDGTARSDGRATGGTDVAAINGAGRGGVGVDADWVPATAMAVRQQVRAAIGVFDPAFATYAQDLDYCMRARAAGWRVAQLPDVRVMHVLGATIGDVAGARQDPRALFVDLSLWIRKRHAQAPELARRLQRALSTGVAARIAARQMMRPLIRGEHRTAWDRDTSRYREAAAALRHARSAHPRLDQR